MRDVFNDDDDDDDNNNSNLKDFYMLSVISPCKNCISPRCTPVTNFI
jgi:hypothetical protein